MNNAYYPKSEDARKLTITNGGYSHKCSIIHDHMVRFEFNSHKLDVPPGISNFWGEETCKNKSSTSPEENSR